MNSPGERLRALREEKGLSAADLGVRVGRSESAVRNQENGTNGIPAGLATKYASALGTTAAYILYGDGPEISEQPAPPSDEIEMPIRYEVAGGVWLESDDIRDEPYGFAPAHRVKPFEPYPQWLERVRGESMNRRLPDGTLIHVVDAISLGYAPRNEDLVVIVRRRAQGALTERSVKEVELTPEGVKLWPRSYDTARWKEPLSLSVGLRDGEDVEVEVVGLVIRAYFPVIAA